MHFIQAMSWRDTLIALFVALIILAVIFRGIERLDKTLNDLFRVWDQRGNRHRRISTQQLNRDRWASNYRPPALRDFK